MATYDIEKPSLANASAGYAGSAYGRKNVWVETVVDTTGSATNDIINCISVPIGMALVSTGLEVLTVDSAGNSGTVQILLDSTSRGTAAAPTAAGYTQYSATGAGPSASLQKINLKVATGAINAVIRVWAEMLDVRDHQTASVSLAGVRTSRISVP